MIPGELRSAGYVVQPPKKKKKDKPTPSPFAVVVKANGFSSNPLHFHRNISDNRKKKVVSADVYSGNKNRPGRELELMPV